MTLAAGKRLGPYEILSPLGAGGMGEVYKALDPKLGREVAIKVLPERTARDPEALARFEREARAVAALNHPNILGIYDIGRVEGLAYAVMELLEGESLRDRIEAGAIPARKTVDYALQITSGLAAAHERGIVHRDLKPENVFLTSNGRVKILDFGLAKRIGKADDETTSAPTMSQQTDPGTVMGTVGYMSPEQVRGLAVDGRSDIFSFGAILYEMLSGRRAFRRDTAGDTMSAILRDDPPELAESGRKIPPGLERIVRHCLEKNPAERFHSARDIAFDLEAVTSASTTGTARPGALPGRRRRVRPAVLAAAAAGLALGALADRVLRKSPEPPLVAIRPLTHSGKDMLPAISPDGKTMAFTSGRDGRARIWLKQLATGDEIALTEGPDFGPRFSPDGSQILFVHGEPQQATGAATESDLYRIPLIGGVPKKIAAHGSDAEWSPDGRTIVFVRLTGADTGQVGRLLVVPAEGGEPREIASWPQRFLAAPRFSPDGRTIVLPSFPSLANSGGRFEVVAVDGSSRRSLPVPPSLGFLSNVVWGAGAHDIVYAQALNVRYGAGRLLREDLRSGRATPLVWLPFEAGAIDTLAGKLVVDGASSSQNLAEYDLGNPSAPPRWLARGTSADRQPVFSPDGEWVAFSSNRSGNLDIWEISTKTGAIRRMTEDDADDWDPGFTRDGKLIWSSGRTGHLEIWTADADGSSPRAVTNEKTDAENPTSTPDGWIVFALTNNPKPGLYRVKRDGSGAERIGPCLNIPETSPDGRYVACPDLGIGPIRVVRLADRKVLPLVIDVPHSRPTETALGRPRWSPDGRKIYFVGQDEKGTNGIFVQDFDTEKTDTSASRRKVAGFDPNVEAESFAISPDGKHLVIAFLDRTYGISTIEGVRGIGRGTHP